MPKTTTNLGALGAVVALLVGCAGSASAFGPNLGAARAAYEEAARGDAAKLAPDKLASAEQALRRAEAAHADDPDSTETAHLAYVAERTAQTAVILARQAQARKEVAEAKKLREQPLPARLRLLYDAFEPHFTLRQAQVDRLIKSVHFDANRIPDTRRPTAGDRDAVVLFLASLVDMACSRVRPGPFKLVNMEVPVKISALYPERFPGASFYQPTDWAMVLVGEPLDGVAVLKRPRIVVSFDGTGRCASGKGEYDAGAIFVNTDGRALVYVGGKAWRVFDKTGWSTVTHTQGAEDYPPEERHAIREHGARVVALRATALFVVGGSEVLPAAEKRLDALAIALDKEGYENILVEGHTDSVGSAQANLELSRKRADAMREQLIRRGIDANRIQSQGLGGDRPAATRLWSEGHANNRRVEVVVTPAR
jgi:outer membrane protein OmpA-like peptidoglycan-associated protein